MNKNPLGFVRKISDLKIESDLDNADKNMSFSYLARTHDIKNEYYIRTQTDEYVVKTVNQKDDGMQEITAVLNVEELEGTPVPTFYAKDQSLETAAELILEGTGWTAEIQESLSAKVRTLNMSGTDVYQVLKNLAVAYFCEVWFDTLKKVVHYVEEIGEDRGAYFIRGLNLISLDVSSDSTEFYTQIHPVGKDNLTIESVNDGKKYLSNFSYSKKVKTYYWKDENYTDPTILKEDAEKKLKELAEPAESYTASITDLAAQSEEYSMLEYRLGDRIALIDGENEIRKTRRIKKMTEYPLEPEKNTCEISNATPNFEEIQKKIQDAAALVEDLTGNTGIVLGSRVEDFTVVKDGLAMVGGKVSALEDWKVIASSMITKEGIINTVGEYYAKHDDVIEIDQRLATTETVATQTKDKFNWIVKSGTSSTDFTLTDRTAELIADRINLIGLISFSGLNGDTQGRITGAENTAKSAEQTASNAASAAENAGSLADTASATAKSAEKTANDAAVAAGEAGKLAEKATQTVDSATAAAASAGRMADAASTAAAEATKIANATNEQVANWCAENDKTLIDGAKIYTKSVTALQINTDDLFSKKLTATNLHITGNSTIDGNLITSGINAEKITTGILSTDRLDINSIFAQEITATGTITGAFLKGSRLVTAAGEKGIVDITGDVVSANYSYNSDEIQEMRLRADGLSFGESIKNGNSVETHSYVSLDQNGLYIQDIVHLSRSAAQATFSCNVVAPGLGVNGSADVSNDLRVYGGATVDKGFTVKNAGLELYMSTPFIDFHFGDSNAGYTSRIIELESGKLNINGAVFTDGGTIWGTGLTINGAGSFSSGITSGNESRFWVGSGNYQDPYPGKSCTIKSWGTVASLRFAAKGVGNTWLGAAKPDGAAYDTICTDANALVPGWRVRTADGAWVGASYAQDPGFRIYYCNASRLAGSSNGTDAIYTFGSSGTFHTKSVSQTSDEREKNILSCITERYENLFMRLKPVLFSWKTGEDGIHMGFGAQTTLQLAEQCGLSENELAAVHKSKTEEPWSMSYTEIVPLTVQMTQKAIREVENVKNTFFENKQIAIENKEKIEALQEQIRQLYVYISELQTVIQACK